MRTAVVSGAVSWSVMVVAVVAVAQDRPGAPRIETTGTTERRDLVDAALRASGYSSAVGLRRARVAFESHVGPLVQDLVRVKEPRARASVLLRSLHQKGGLLGRYDPRATTLRDVLERRTYNCVSASVLYNLIAHRLDLSVAAQLLPTHARSMLSLEQNGRLVGVVVETTSADGFDPSADEQAAVLAAVTPTADQGGRSLVPDRGAIVDTAMLIGTIYVNRASIAQEAGALERAEHLFAEAERSVSAPAMKRMLADQRAALLAQLAADDINGGDPQRWRRALRTLAAAARLAPSSPDIAQAVQQNLRALAALLLSDKAAQTNERTVLATSRKVTALMTMPAARAAVRALALSRIARLRAQAGNYEGALRALDQAMSEKLDAAEDRLRLSLREHLIAVLRMAAQRRAEAGDTTRSEGYLRRLDTMTVDEKTRRLVQADRLRVFQVAGNARLDKQDYRAAARIFRAGLEHFPEDSVLRNNLLVALQNIALPLVQQLRCDRAASYLAEIRKLKPQASFANQATARCLIGQADRLLEAGDFPGAVRVLRSGDESPPIKRSLSVALLRWTSALAGAGRCGEARKRAEEAGQTGVEDRRQVARALGRCAR